MPINPTDLKSLIDTQITNETVDFAITPAEVGGRIKDAIDYATEQASGKENSINKSSNVVTDAESITKYPNVKAVKDYADSIVVGLLDDRGNHNASTNLFPSIGGSGASGTILKGDLWFISVAGTLGGVSVPVGASLRALVDSPAQTSANWSVLNAGLGFTPENVLNKSISVITDGESDTKYPSAKAVKTYVDAAVLSGGPQKVIRGCINQFGTSNPTLTVFENTFGTLPTMTRISTGSYVFNFSETINMNKVFCLIGFDANDPLGTRLHIGIVSNGGTITVGVNKYRLKNGNAPTDELYDGITRASFEIRLYP